MNFHVASRASPLTLASQQEGYALIVPIKSLKKILARFARLVVFF